MVPVIKQLSGGVTSQTQMWLPAVPGGRNANRELEGRVVRVWKAVCPGYVCDNDGDTEAKVSVIWRR